MATDPTPKATSLVLRNLPLPAKLVITCFLLAVGGGYTAAMVQLHFQDSKSGQPMPTVADVVLKFTGKKWFESDPPRPVSKFVKLILAPEDGPTFSGTGTMSPAFFGKDDGTFGRLMRTGDEAARAALRSEREGERNALALWATAPLDVRERAYHTDQFKAEDAPMPAAITPEFKNPDGSVKVKSIIDARCARCHNKDGAQSNYPLETYEQVGRYLAVPATVTVKPGGDWVKVEEPIGLEKLTQSTHAHLLSFAMLFSLTGLVFAFTSYPTVCRCVLGPWVVLAVVADVSMWWLARLSPEWGPYFAMAVIGTGGAAGAGLSAQIVLGLWNMYGFKGRAALGLVALIGAFAGWQVYLNQIQPGLLRKQNSANAKADPANAAEEHPADAGKKNAPDPKAGRQAGPIPDRIPPAADVGANPPDVRLSPMERVFHFPVKDAAGKEIPLLKIPFKKDQEGGMVRAFFDQDGADFKKVMKGTDQGEQTRLLAERHGELAAFTAWIHLADPDRRKTYDADAFELPPALAGKPVTSDYLAAGKLKVKTLIADRCVRCHAPGGDGEQYPLETYDQIHKEMLPR